MSGQNTNVLKLYRKVISESLEGYGLEQRKYYLNGIGTYEVNRLSVLERVGKAIYNGLEKAFVWFVLRKHLSHYSSD